MNGKLLCGLWMGGKQVERRIWRPASRTGVLVFWFSSNGKKNNNRMCVTGRVLKSWLGWNLGW